MTPGEESTGPPPLSAVRLIDALCDEFESVLRQGVLPAFDDFLHRVDAATQGPLLMELIPLAVEGLRSRGIVDPIAELIACNPDSADAILQAAAEADEPSLPVAPQTPRPPGVIPALDATIDRESDSRDRPVRINQAILQIIKRQYELLCQQGLDPEIPAQVQGIEPEVQARLSEELALIRTRYRREGPTRVFLAPDDSEQPTVDLPSPTQRDQPTVDHWPTPTAPGRGHLRLPLDSFNRDDEGERFQALRPLAAGGIGEVMVALDHQVKREVALKKLQAQHEDHEQKRERFLLEGYVTGALEHPGVVPIYALGSDGRGQPFYAMRLIRGQTLKVAIRAFHVDVPPRPADRPAKWSPRNGALRELLQRYAAVCVTAAYAHSRGVVHRDLKPDNVMLGKYGETYVVDWGMARVLGSRAEEFSAVTEEVVRFVREKSDSATQYGSAMGTPGYMSPEQAAGRIDEIGPKADIYSLGAILYYLLTNTTPISAESLSEFLRKVNSGEYPAPHAINPAAPKGLEAVALKAMAVAPQDRYDSAREIAAEVDRWLADEPVGAASETWIERAGRYVRRNYRWLAPLALATALVALVASVSAVAINRARGRAEAAATAEEFARSRADKNFLKARETVERWLTGYSDALAFLQLPGTTAVRTQMLELAAQEYEAFVAEESNDPTLQLERGRTLVRLGSIYRLLGRNVEADHAYADAVEALNAIADRDAIGPSAEASLALARGLQASLAADQGDVAQAEERFVGALADVETALADSPENSELLRAAATVAINRGGVLAKAERFDAAEAAFVQAQSLCADLQRISPHDLNARALAATAQIGVGQLTFVRGDARGAASIQEQAAEFAAGAAQIDPHDPKYRQLAVTAYGHLATSRRRLGDSRGEQEAYRRAIQAAEKLQELRPDAPLVQVHLAMMKTDLGQSLVEQFQPVQAEPLLQDAAAALMDVVARQPQVPEYRESLGAALVNLAQAEQIRGQYGEALVCTDKAISELEQLVKALPEIAAYQERLAVAESTAAQIQFLKGEEEKAVELFTSAVDRLKGISIQERATLAQRETTAIILARFAAAEFDANLALSEELYERVRSEWEKILADSRDSQLAAEAAWFFAACPLPEMNDPARAKRLLFETDFSGVDNDRLSFTSAAIAAVNEDWEAYDRAVARADRDDSPLSSGWSYLGAFAANARQDRTEALRHWRRAEDDREALLPGDWDLLMVRRLVAASLQLKEIKFLPQSLYQVD